MVNYERFKFGDFDHWGLYLHTNQAYLGRCYAWAKRADAKNVLDMNKHERDELFEKVIPLWNSTVHDLFQHDWPNVDCLANEAPHLHWHLVPRYKTPRKFANVTFTDERWGKHWSPYNKEFSMGDEGLWLLKEIMEEAFLQNSK